MNEFSKLVSDFFIRYLTNQKNASENTIKTYLTPVLADQLIDGKIKPHDTIILDVNEQKEIIVQHQL